MPVTFIIHMKSIKENKTESGMVRCFWWFLFMDDVWIEPVAVHLYLTNCDCRLMSLERDFIPQRFAFNLSS